MPKLQLLFEAGPMVDKKKTGVGHYTHQLISSLAAHSKDSVTMTGYYYDFLGRNYKVPPKLGDVRYKQIRFIPGKLLSICRRLRFQPPLEIFVRQKTDVILYTNYVCLPTVRPIRSALIVYDLSFLDHPEYLQEVNLQYLQRFCPPSIRSADTIITISEFSKQRILHYFPGIKANIIITPIPPEARVVAETLDGRLTQLGIKSGRYILYIGTIEPRKNLQNLVRAYASLPDAIRNTYALVIAGGRGWKDEAILSEIKHQQERGLSIVLPGYISDREKTSLYAHSSCFVLPSHYEGFGMPILEAMQYGIPVAVSDIPVFHEVAGDAALYFDKDSPADISTTIQRLLTDKPGRTTLVKAGHDQLTRYSWQRNAIAVYEALASND